jgi:tight adherence protein C
MVGVVEYLPIIVGVFTFMAMCLLFFAIFQLNKVRSDKRELIRKIQQSAETTSPLKPFSGPPARAAQSRVLNFLGLVGKRVSREKAIDHSRTRLAFLRAGIRWENAQTALWGAKIVLALLFPLFFLGATLAYPDKLLFSRTILVAICVVCAAGGFYLPNIWLRLKTNRRKEKIRDGFADALDLLVVCVEAGMGLDSGVQRVAREIKLSSRELADELNMTNLEMRAGKMRRDALKNLALRTDLEDVKSLVNLLIQADKLGTGIGQALRVFSDSFRTKRYQRAEEAAAKIPVKLILPLILFIFPTLLVTIMGPAAIRIYQVLLPALGRGG